ncbi:MAG: EVE domain-containing protein [Gemmatimonadales bacterium]
MPASWLLKTEPKTYSFDRLLQEGRTTWDGVHNNLALQHLRAMKAGDRLLIYHSGAEKAVVGTGKVVKAAYQDPTQEDPRVVVVDISGDTRLPTPVTLATLKAESELKEFPLIRMTRLSVMPVPAEVWKRIVALGGAKAQG